jgi:nucleoside-diphosphate-sugar epimerase
VLSGALRRSVLFEACRRKGGALPPDELWVRSGFGHTKEISNQHLAVLVKTMTDSVSEIVRVPYEDAYELGFEDMPRRAPDISKIRRLIGYRPMPSA